MRIPFKPLVGACFALATLATLVASPALRAADYPDRAVRVIINSSPGGLTDVVGRLVTVRMTQNLGQQFIVKNRAGQAVIGADALAKAKNDGYTVGVLGNSLSAMPALLPKMPFDAQKDLIPVALLNTSQLVLITNPNSPYKTLSAPEVRDRMIQLGTNPEGGPPKVLADLVASELPRWAGLIKERNIKAK